MHRSRSLLLAILAVAACSRPKRSENTKTLSQDSTLASRVISYQATDEKTGKGAYPAACGAVAPAAQPSVANRTQAQQLAQRASNAEMLGNIQDASSLWRRASELDATDKSAAYHLGRVSEALNEPTAAIAAYCRYLTLSPTKAERAEARQRLLSLSSSQIQSQVVTATPNALGSRGTASSPRVVAKAHIEHAAREAQPKHATHSISTAASGAVELPTPTKPAAPTPEVFRRADSVTVSSDDVEVVPSVPTVEQPRTPRRGPSRVQTAGIGAVTGAIIGGMTGRSAKAAAIGAAAGGILGAIVVRGDRGG